MLNACKKHASSSSYTFKIQNLKFNISLTSPLMSTSSPTPAWPLALRLAALWLVYVAWSTCAGWILSYFGSLNATGYLLAALPLMAALIAVWQTSSGVDRSVIRIRSMAKRPAAVAWSIVALMGLVGGLLYAPSNYDALSYRLPRILYWLQENRWHWLEHADQRMNYSGVGIEWQSLPIMLLTGGDRCLFLLNWLPFLLFPALTFHAYRTFGTGNQSAARWMWIVPLGYGFALQASSIGNDALGGILALNSIAFAGLAIRRASSSALLLSAIAAAAITGLKASSLPLMLPLAWFWLTAAWQIRSNLRPFLLLPGFAAIIFVSFLPLAVLNHIHCGNWAGDPDDRDQLRITKTIPGLLGNTYNVTIGTLQPPLLPISAKKKDYLLSPITGENSLASYIQTGFPRFKAHIGREIPIEEDAGIGIGIALLLIAPLFGRRRQSKRSTSTRIAIATTIIAVFAYMAKMGSESTARLMLPYMPLLAASWLAILPHRPRRHACYRMAVTIIPILCLLPSLLLNPNRPLIPLKALSALPVLPEKMRDRILSIHEGYSSRNDPLHEIRSALPTDCRLIGYAGGPTRSAYSLFKPIGSRRVIEAHRANINSFEWLVASPEGIKERAGQSWEQWLAASPYTISSRYCITFTVQFGPEDWFLLRRKNPTDTK
jgi:hypothetical protein